MMHMVAPLEVGFSVVDLDRLAKFYTDVLGFELVSIIDVPADMSERTGQAPDGFRVARLQTPYGERIKLFQPVSPPEPLSRPTQASP